MCKAWPVSRAKVESHLHHYRLFASCSCFRRNLEATKNMQSAMQSLCLSLCSQTTQPCCACSSWDGKSLLIHQTSSGPWPKPWVSAVGHPLSPLTLQHFPYDLLTFSSSQKTFGYDTFFLPNLNLITRPVFMLIYSSDWRDPTLLIQHLFVHVRRVQRADWKMCHTFRIAPTQLLLCFWRTPGWTTGLS